jgi:hypothetical protein
MLSWTPAALVFYTRHCKGICCGKSVVVTTATAPPSEAVASSLQESSAYRQRFEEILKTISDYPSIFFEKILPCIIIKPRLGWIIGLGSIVVASIVAIFYFPGLKLPDKEQFQLFKSDHIFEKYDLVYKKYFGFEKDEQQDISYKMPLRFIWGIKPVDYGNYLDPSSKGILEYDSEFDVSSTDSQRWMLRFCEQVRKQPFYKHTLGPLLSNCFMETFKEWMERRCKDDLTGEDRAPCCQASMFPYTTPIFER